MSLDTGRDFLRGVAAEVRGNIANITTEEDAKLQIILRFFLSRCWVGVTPILERNANIPTDFLTY
jgi:hypothetical protein